MEADLMQAVLQSFLDADLRVEVVPRTEEKSQSRTADTGSGPSYDATTQAYGRLANNCRRPPEAVRMNTFSGPTQVDSSAQAVDGQYASVYRVNHCKVTPTSPPPMTSEFPPQRADISYGCDNFQVGGMGSGETRAAPLKASSYRGAGLNWPNRGEVYAPRMSRCSDPFARSLRKYPPVSPERSEVLERLVTYAMPRTYRSPRQSPNRSPQREPVRKTYEEYYRPRAPEEDPTRDRRDDFNHYRQGGKQAFAKHGDARHVREMSRRLRKSLKSISSYTHTHTLATYLDGIEQERDTPIMETSETEHEELPVSYSYPVNTTVQAVVPTTSMGVEAKPLPSTSRRTIAVPLSPTPSSRLSMLTEHIIDPRHIPTFRVEDKHLMTNKRTIAIPVTPSSSRLTTRAPDLPRSYVTKSVQTFPFPGRSVETVTSTTELPKNPVKVMAKKSKSLNDFRLNRDFKSEILEWIDDTNDPNVKEIQEVVLRSLNYRLKGISTSGAGKIQVKIGNCLKSCGNKVAKKLTCELDNNEPCGNTNHSQEVKDTKQVTDHSEFKIAMEDWFNTLSMNKRDFISKPVEKEQILSTFINRLKYLAIGKSKHCSEQTMRADILRILDEVLIEGDASDKTAFLNKLTDTLMYKLDNILLGDINTKPTTCKDSEKSSADMKTHVQVTKTGMKDFVVNEMKDDIQFQEVFNPDLIKQTIVDLVDILKDSVNNNIGLEEIGNTLHNTTKHSGRASKFTENCRDMHSKRHATSIKTQPLTVFMLQTKSFIKKASTTTSQLSIGSIIERDIEANLNQYKIQLAQRIDQWLSDLAILRAQDTDFRQAVILDLASDIVDRQKYLEFKKNKSSDIDELEHLKYLIFKWMRRYIGEDNMETVHHAVELMEMIRNIPVPMLSRSQDLLHKSNSRLCCKKNDHEPGISTDISKDNVYNSKSDSGIHNFKGSESGSPSYTVIENVSINKDIYLKKQRLQSEKSSPCNRLNKCNPSHTILNNNSFSSKCATENLINSNETLKNNFQNEVNVDANHMNTEKVDYSTSLFKNLNKDGHSSQDSFVSSRSRDDFYCKSRNDEHNPSIDISKEDRNTSKPQTCCKSKIIDPVLTNYVVHKVIATNQTNDGTNQREEIASTRSGSKNRKRSSKISPSSKTCESKCASKFHSLCNVTSASASETEAKDIQLKPEPSGLVTPVPSHSGKPSSAAQLMAEWQPPPVFTLPPHGLSHLDQVHEEFREYLQNWCKQLPLPANNCEEAKSAEKSRAGILNGIWKMLTKLKTQPAVFQNRFYYEDVLGKEMDGLLDCLPQTPELQEQKYTLKAQLLEKISNMNDLIKEVEMPDNYKQMVAQKTEVLKEEKIRKTVKLGRENPTHMIEEMLKYCTLDDFLAEIDYKETNNILDKAYKNRLLDTIQIQIDKLKRAHGKEMEHLFGFWKESDIFEILRKVPVPTEDSIREDADEIILGLEIDQWMNDLPIIKNDDGNEQRQRTRLRDALTKKLHEMGKRTNISDCCADTQVKHEISVFLDRVPLERDQDLHINQMVDELTNRLKNRHGAEGRRRSVAFQDESLYQQGNQPSRLLNRSDLTFGPGSNNYSPENKWAFQEDDDAQYRDLFQNAPLCSTRNDQPSEWALDEDPDTQYRALFKDGVPCSSMIEQQGGYGPGPMMPPDFRHSYDQAPHFDFPHGQFHESHLGGSFGYPVHESRVEERYQYPDAIGSQYLPQQGPTSPRFYESAAEVMPHASIPDSQFQSLRGHSYMPGMDAQVAPRMERADFNRSQGMRWIPPVEPSGFVSMQEDGAPSPPIQMAPPNRRFSNGIPAFSSHLSHLHHNMSLSQAERSAPQGYISATSYRAPQGFMSIDSEQLPGAMPLSFRSSARNEPYIEPQPAFIPDQSRFSRGSPTSRSNREIGRSVRQQSVEDSVTTNQSMAPPEPLEVSVQVHQASRSKHQEPAGEAAPRFISMVSQQRPRNASEASAPPQQSASRPGQPSIRVTPARNGKEEIQGQNRSQDQARKPVQNRQSTRDSRDHTPTDRLTASREPSPPQRSRLQASAPSTEISNQPAFYSTPNHHGSNPPPPNIRERRQIEKERVPARRLDMNAEDGEGEERCHCRERFNRWNRRSNCHTCDECLHGGFHPYPFPFTYMYPPFGRPQYPPHCRK